MHQIEQPEVTEPRNPAEEAAYLRWWLMEWSKRHPGERHPLQPDPADWSETLPAEI